MSSQPPPRGNSDVNNPGPSSQEDLVRQLNEMRAHLVSGALPALPVQGAPASTAMALSQFHISFRDQPVQARPSGSDSATNLAFANTDIISQLIPNMSLQAANTLQQSLLQAQAQMNAMPAINYALARATHIQTSSQQNPVAQTAPKLNEGAIKGPGSCRNHTSEKSMGESLQQKITQKIQEKLKSIKPKDADEQHQLHNQMPQTMKNTIDVVSKQPAKTDSEGAGPVVMNARERDPIKCEEIPASIRGGVDTKTVLDEPKEQPPTKRRKRGVPKKDKEDANKKNDEKTPDKQTSSWLDGVVESLFDENICCAIKEDRDNIRAKQRDTQKVYDDQLKEMHSRLRMYTALEAIAEQIAVVRNSKNSKKSDGALDMCHIAVKDYRMLEDTFDMLCDSRQQQRKTDRTG